MASVSVISQTSHSIWCHLCQKYGEGLYVLHPEIGNSRLLQCRDCQSDFVEKSGQNVESFLSPESNRAVADLSSSTISYIRPQPMAPTARHYQTTLSHSHFVRHIPDRYPGPNSSEAYERILRIRADPSPLLLGIDSLRLTARYRRLMHTLTLSDTATNGSLSDATLERLPRIQVTAGTDTEALGGSCGICQEPFEAGDTVVRLQCGHCFKEEGALFWLRTRDTCPVCRVKIHDEFADESVTGERASPIDLSLFNHHEIGITPVP